MTIEQRVTKLEKSLARLNDSFVQAQKNQVPITSKTDENSNNIKSLTPYTDTKIGYYGETEKVFYDVPEGNVTVYGLSAYNVSRISNRLILTFDALTDQTSITISIL